MEIVAEELDYVVGVDTHLDDRGAPDTTAPALPAFSPAAARRCSRGAVRREPSGERLDGVRSGAHPLGSETAALRPRGAATRSPVAAVDRPPQRR
jgi:hypothetical protein